MTEPDTTVILVALAEIRGELAGVRHRIDAIEVARSVARHEQEDWRDEVRDELREIRRQTTDTNGKVQKHALVLAQMRGVASVFSWWKAAVAGVIAAIVGYALTQL